MGSLKVGVVFCGGLGGIEWALKYENIKHDVIMSAEIDKYARKQYIEFHGKPKNFYQDVYDIDGLKYRGKIDLFHASSPCQSFSMAGKRGGKADKRGSLIEECVRLVDEIRPKVFTYENVAGLKSIDNGKTFTDFIQAYRDLGYFVAHKLINAKECGTAQNRLRLFVVGFLSEDNYHNFSFAESIPLTKCLRDYLEDDIDEKYYLSQKMIANFIKKDANTSFKFTPSFEGEGVSPCLTARYYKMGISDPYIKYNSLQQVGELDIKGADSTKRVYSADGICPTITTMGGGNRQPKVFLPTLEDGAKSEAQPVLRDYRIRRLTEFECFCLMGMKDKDIRLVNSMSQSYKIAGNGIEINTMRSIIRQLYKPIKSSLSLF